MFTSVRGALESSYSIAVLRVREVVPDSVLDISLPDRCVTEVYRRTLRCGIDITTVVSVTNDELKKSVDEA